MMVLRQSQYSGDGARRRHSAGNNQGYFQDEKKKLPESMRAALCWEAWFTCWRKSDCVVLLELGGNR